MRSTGEVMASAADLPTAFAKAERAAGRRLPRSGSVFISIREPDHLQAVPIAATLVGLGFELFATEGTAATLAAAGIEVESVRKLSEATDGEPTVVDLIRRGRCDLVINTPEGRNARSDGYAIREAALARACRASRRSRAQPPPCTRSRRRGARAGCPSRSGSMPSRPAR